jgi:Flp pilus assembly pilin Flp
MTEYIIIIALVAMAAIAVIGLFGRDIKESFGRSGKVLQGESEGPRSADYNTEAVDFSDFTDHVVVASNGGNGGGGAGGGSGTSFGGGRFQGTPHGSTRVTGFPDEDGWPDLVDRVIKGASVISSSAAGDPGGLIEMGIGYVIEDDITKSTTDVAREKIDGTRRRMNDPIVDGVDTIGEGMLRAKLENWLLRAMDLGPIGRAHQRAIKRKAEALSNQSPTVAIPGRGPNQRQIYVRGYKEVDANGKMVVKWYGSTDPHFVPLKIMDRHTSVVPVAETASGHPQNWAAGADKKMLMDWSKK